MSQTYQTLQGLTGHESGAVQYENGDIWIGNWTQIAGIPRVLTDWGPEIGLGEILFAKPVEPPAEVIEAMEEFEREQGNPPSDSSYRAWEVIPGVIAVVNTEWN